MRRKKKKEQQNRTLNIFHFIIIYRILHFLFFIFFARRFLFIVTHYTYGTSKSRKLRHKWCTLMIPEANPRRVYTLLNRSWHSPLDFSVSQNPVQDAIVNINGVLDFHRTVFTEKKSSIELARDTKICRIDIFKGSSTTCKGDNL